MVRKLVHNGSTRGTLPCLIRGQRISSPISITFEMKSYLLWFGYFSSPHPSNGIIRLIFWWKFRFFGLNKNFKNSLIENLRIGQFLSIVLAHIKNHQITYTNPFSDAFACYHEFIFAFIRNPRTPQFLFTFNSLRAARATGLWTACRIPSLVYNLVHLNHKSFEYFYSFSLITTDKIFCHNKNRIILLDLWTCLLSGIQGPIISRRKILSQILVRWSLPESSSASPYRIFFAGGSSSKSSSGWSCDWPNSISYSREIIIRSNFDCWKCKFFRVTSWYFNNLSKPD